MPNYISDAGGNWFDVSYATQLSVETGGMTKAVAVSGLTPDGEV